MAKYRRPVKTSVARLNCLVPLTTGKLLDITPKSAQALLSADSNMSSELFHVAETRFELVIR